VSEVKTDKLSPRTASGTVTLGTSGDTFSIPSGVTLTNNGTASGFGKVLQVVSTFKNDTWSSPANDTYTAITGLSATITPSNTSNKVLIMLELVYGANPDVWSGFKISRDSGSSFIAIANDDGSARDFVSFGFQVYGTTLSASINQEGLTYLDSPSTTSAITYQVYSKGRTGYGSTYLNRSSADNNDIHSGKRGVSSITLMEIAG
jgi:hypothetical protein